MRGRRGVFITSNCDWGTAVDLQSTVSFLFSLSFSFVLYRVVWCLGLGKRVLYLHTLLFVFAFSLIAFFSRDSTFSLSFICASIGYWSKMVCLTAGSRWIHYIKTVYKERFAQGLIQKPIADLSSTRYWQSNWQSIGCNIYGTAQRYSTVKGIYEPFCFSSFCFKICWDN